MSEIPTQPSISVVELDALVEKLFAKRKEIEDREGETKKLSAELVELQTQSVAALHELGRKNYQTAAGTISVVERWRVNLPTTEPDKIALFGYLKEKGLLWQYATVNSNSLNSLYLAGWEAAKEAGLGMEYKIPGIGEPKLFETLSMLKK